MASKRPTKPRTSPVVEVEPLDLDAIIAEKTFAPYPFKLGGKWHEMPHLQSLATEQALQVEDGDGVQVLTALAGEELAQLLLKVPAHAMNDLISGWMRHAGTGPGESGASSDS